MKIENKPTNSLTPYDFNPRKNDNSVDLVAESIKEFGFKQPIVIDKSGVIVAGHTRHQAAIQLGLKTVPCLIADDLTPEQVRAYRIMDNAASEPSEWDNGKLVFELEELGDAYSPEFFGMSVDEFERKIASEEAWDFSELQDFCLVTIKAPLTMQAEIRERLKGLDGIEIEASHILA